jgi:nitrate/TMAO reductase-like tetraheme cytochrome c subunit
MIRATTLAVVLGLAASLPARAGDDYVPPVRDPLVLKECGSCHMAFQPAFLTANAWRTMMGNLSDHFGDNAEMAPEKVQAITDYLVNNASRFKRTSDGQRITQAYWFEKKHRKVPPHVWKDPKVMTASNCPACHQGAEQGWYEDD